MLEGTKVLWEESQSYYDLMVQREDEGYISFDSEMQNEPVNPRDCIFNMEDVHYWDDQFATDDELLAFFKNKGQTLWTYGACDPSTGNKNKRGDYSAIVTMVHDAENDIYYVLDADLDKRPLDKTLDAILMLHDKRKFFNFGFEANGFQDYLADDLTKRALSNGKKDLSVEKIINTTDKRSRIESLQPMIKNGSIRFSKRHRILLEQLKLYPKGKHDDGLDALQMVYLLARDDCSVMIRAYLDP